MTIAREVLTFDLEGEILAVDAREVREILDLAPVTRVPGARRFADGLINVRGQIVPLADLRLKFGMKISPPTVDTRIVVVETRVDGEPAAVGLLADRVREVAELAPEAIAATPDIGLRWRAEYLRGIGKRGGELILLIDLENILASSGARPGRTPEEA
ncbi:CheW protein [uncultured Alphaproteobacteria bacterium]|jgi:purine-binding chemotaxis protein CheW|uniref:CheW protein n=1 Tax=uncultured Alphaproteobacteria bacterium TaxID=91750 RepID=A0A212KKN4_9PROT|nr:CheW protein [uncultured Alphaproteobacteria bacterium]